jgi:hypothetical protein
MAIIQSAIQDPTKALAAAAAAPAATPAPAPVAAPAPAAAPAAAPAPASAPALNTAPIPSDTSVAQVPQLSPDQTVEGRIQSIIAANSPIIQQARTHAMETANSRGLLNSSMAAQAGEAAAFQAATPIATADAATAAKVGQYNVEAANQHGLQQMQSDNAKLLQTNNQASTAFNQALVAIANINNNDKMDAAAKTQAIATIQQNLQSQLKTLGATSGLDLTSQLNFGGYPGFDSNGNFVGFDSGGSTVGSAPAAAAPAMGPWGGAPVINLPGGIAGTVA